MRGRIPQQPPPPCTPLVAVIIVAAATATVLADTVAAFLGLVRAIHECGGDVETMLRRSMRRRESLKPSRRQKSSSQATSSSSLRSLVVPRPSVRVRSLPGGGLGGHSFGDEISPIQGRNVGPIRNRFHALAHPDDPNTIRTRRPRVGASLQLRQPRRSRHLPSSDWERLHRSPPPRPRVRPLSLPPLGSRPLALSFPVRHRGKYRGCSVLAIAINGGRRREQRFRTDSGSLSRGLTKRAVRNPVPR